MSLSAILASRALDETVALTEDGAAAITWRRFWNRIERATARLQGEWGVGAGTRVAWRGAPRPDVLTLLFALSRLDATLVLDDDAAADVIVDDAHGLALDSLIATHCPHRSILMPPDLSLPLLIANGLSLSHAQLLAHARPEVQATPERARITVNAPRLEADDLCARILPALAAGRGIDFGACQD